jgi:uncharacterized protein (DUF427 family)
MEQTALTATKPIKVPGPDHPIAIERNPNRVVVLVAGRVIADTREALTLREAAYPAVQYIPRKDVEMALLDRTDHATYCPYKGDCAYFSIPLGRRAIDQRSVELRDPLCLRRGHQGPSRLLPRPRRRDRGTTSGLNADPPPSLAPVKWGQRAPRSIGTIGGEQPARMTPSPSKPNRWYNAVLAELLDSR